MEFSAELVVWTCEASNATRSYVVESLSQAATQFEMRVSDGSQFDRYQETVVMQIHSHPSRFELVGTGNLRSGEAVQVTAFAEGGVAFRVKDDRGDAVGHCIRHVTAN